MPVDINKDSQGCFARWGVEGKKYYYECGNEEERNKAKEKAYKQGYAIGDLEERDKLIQRVNRIRQKNLQSGRVSFDYDGVLSISRMKDKVQTLVESGVDVFIISARHDNTEMIRTALTLGIPTSRVFATGSNKAKIQKIKDLRINTHYDNNPDVIKQLPGVGILVR